MYTVHTGLTLILQDLLLPHFTVEFPFQTIWFLMKPGPWHPREMYNTFKMETRVVPMYIADMFSWLRKKLTEMIEQSLGKLYNFPLICPHSSTCKISAILKKAENFHVWMCDWVAYMFQWTMLILVQIMDGAKPLSEPVLMYCQLDTTEHISMKFYLKLKYFHSRKCNLNCRQQWRPFYTTS